MGINMGAVFGGLAKSLDDRLKDDMRRTGERSDRVRDYHITRASSKQDKFDKWVPVFLSMLVNIAYKTQGKVNDKKCVLEPTNKYREGQDHFQEFANDKIITLDEDDVENSKLILINVLFDEYKNWYKDNHGNNNHKKRSELKSYMDKKFHKYWVEGTTYSKRGWRGIQVIDSCSIDSDRDELD